MNSQKIASQTGISLAEETIQAFQARLQGTIILPDDPDYDGARRVWYAMIDKCPALIARCADAADVTTAVNLARDQGIPLAVRGGNFGVVTSFEFRLRPVGPEILFLTTMYPIDLGQNVMTAWREWARNAPEEASTDCLFWSIPASPPFPEPLHGTPVVVVGGMYVGSKQEGLEAFRPLRQIGEPLIDMTGPMPYTQAQSMFDPFFAEGSRQYWKSLYLDDLSDEAIATIVERAKERPSSRTMVPVRHLGGAVGRVGETETAVANRSAQFLFSADSTWDDPDADESNVTCTRNFWQEMHRFSEGGILLSFPGLGEEGQQLVEAAHGPNHERLVALKNKYDASNLFRMNQNIKPTV